MSKIHYALTLQVCGRVFIGIGWNPTCGARAYNIRWINGEKIYLCAEHTKEYDHGH